MIIRQPKHKKKREIEIGDVLFSTICIANTLDIDIEQALKIIEELIVDLELPPAVVNVLIDYVLKTYDCFEK